MSHDLFKPVPITVPRVGGSKQKYAKDENGLLTPQPDYVTTGGLQRILNEFAFKIQMASIEQIKQRIPMSILILDAGEAQDPTIEFRVRGGVENKIRFEQERLDSDGNTTSGFSIWQKDIRSNHPTLAPDDVSGNVLGFDRGDPVPKISNSVGKSFDTLNASDKLAID